MKFLKGQASLIALFSTAGAILVALIGGYFGQSSLTDAKVEKETDERKEVDLAIIERVAITETHYTNIEKKVDKVETKIDELLRRTLK